MIRVLFSYPLRFNKKGIGLTAWHQVTGLIRNGAEVDLFCASCDVNVDPKVRVKETMVPMGFRIPLKLLGYKSYIMHDYIVSNHLKRHFQDYDIVHCWPLGGLNTLCVAKKHGLKTFTERPNTHTEYAFEVVKRECQMLHYSLPKNHSHFFNARKLAREEKEYEIADKLLCPSQFVYDSYINKGFPESKLSLYHYGYDPKQYYSKQNETCGERPFRAVFMGSCEPRKGLHYALKAWLNSTACKKGELLICGNYVEGYREILKDSLKHPSVKEVGFIEDAQSVLSECDIMILPTIEEGSAIVTYEARACGCVILVSDAAGAWGKHLYDLMTHRVGDVESLTKQINLLYQDRGLLKKIKENGLETMKNYTWDHAAGKLIKHYKESLK